MVELLLQSIMIICTNCGTLNKEENVRICRNCGALLPVSSRHPRLRTPKEQKEKKKKRKEKKVEKTVPVLKPIPKPEPELVLEPEPKPGLVLHDIPKVNEIPSESEDSHKKPTKNETPHAPIEYQEIPLPESEKIEGKHSEDTYKPEKSKNGGLEEITPQPFKGSVITPRKIYGSLSTHTQDPISDAFSQLKQSVTEKKEEPVTPLPPSPQEVSDSNLLILKQKRLEEDMSEVLSFLSKKISVNKIQKPKIKAEVKKKAEEEIPPASMNDILKRLSSLDLHIEASAIIKTNGEILASAISSRISDSLFATIGMNLSMIGTDIIDGLNGGSLKSISVRGTDGVLDLAPIDRDNPSVQDMLLILFSHPKVKSGIISFAVNIVKKQIKTYLGLES